jgi:hypothetical protein
VTDITQSDREAAANLIEDQKPLYVDGVYVSDIRTGGNDSNAIVQAFAAHRIAAIEEAAQTADVAAMEAESDPVAWAMGVSIAHAIRALANQPHNQEG